MHKLLPPKNHTKHTQTHTHIHSHTLSHTHSLTYMHTQTYVHTHARTLSYTTHDDHAKIIISLSLYSPRLRGHLTKYGGGGEKASIPSDPARTTRFRPQRGTRRGMGGAVATLVRCLLFSVLLSMRMKSTVMFMQKVLSAITVFLACGNYHRYQYYWFYYHQHFDSSRIIISE